MTASDRSPSESFAGEPLWPDPYREWDAAYVLGSLSPAERREYEEHLASCAGCRSAIAELAGMPGLLGQIPTDDAAVMVASTTGPAAAEAPPETPDLLQTAVPPRLLPQVVSLRDRQRRLVTAVVALAAAFVLLAGVVGVAAVRGSFTVDRPSSSAPLRLAFANVVPSGITAIVTLVPVADGTELEVECQYANEYAAVETGRRYNIFVNDRSGRATQVKSWVAKPNKVNTPSAHSPLPVSKIASVEIRPDGSDQAWLRAELR